MKNTKQSLIIASLLLAALVVAPATSFAKNDSMNINAKHESRASIAWNKISDLFGVRAKAAVRVTPEISGITAPTVLKVDQTGTWKVKASDPQNGSLEYSVNWGDEDEMKSLAQSAFVQTTTFTHAYAKAGDYTITFTVRNEAGNETTSTVTVHVDGDAVNAPVISDLKATLDPNKPRRAVIEWDTDVRSNSMVWLSTESPVDVSGRPDASSRWPVTDHTIRLNRLAPDTTYYVIVASENRDGRAVSEEISFKTPAKPDQAGPVITSISGDTEVVVGEETEVMVKAYDPKNGSLSYSADWGDSSDEALAAKMMTPIEQTSTFTHVYTEAGTYTATFTVENEAGKKVSSSLDITVAEAPSDGDEPVISDIEADAGINDVMIAWMTDEPATSKVYYSTSSSIDVDADGTLFVSSNGLSTDHELDITGLAASTTYYFVIESADEAGNEAYSAEGSFVTDAEV